MPEVLINGDKKKVAWYVFHFVSLYLLSSTTRETTDVVINHHRLTNSIAGLAYVDIDPQNVRTRIAF